ncbi:MAG: hypothetical protein FWC38_08690 [Proteobacteria bacterium]|nr:hypothetical protein [Pseudomonadota bacterium]MCL2308277.1 hypothetical protein [Pseudomonadota bacterium]
MNFLKRLLKSPPPHTPLAPFPKGVSAEPTGVCLPQEEKSANQPPYTAVHISDVLCVTEIANAEFFVGDLFRRRFNTPSFPDMPRHFVAFYKIDENTMMPVGYVHQTPWENCYLCGGLVIDDRRYRRIPSAHRRIIRDAGGVAEYLQRESFAALEKDTLAIWGIVGDKLAEQVDLRVGFVHTDRPPLMVVWLKPLPEEEKAAWVQKAAALGMF